MRVNLHHCIKCQNFSTIDVDLITTEINKKEVFEEKKEDYSLVFILNNQEFINFKNKLSNAEESKRTEQ